MPRRSPAGCRRRRGAARRTCTASRGGRRRPRPGHRSGTCGRRGRRRPASSRAVRQLDDPPHVGQRADGVRRDRESGDARAAGELPLEVGEVDVAVVRDVGETTTRPRSWASSSHGETLPSWSRRVTTISSPAFHVRAAVGEPGSTSEGHVRAERHLFGGATEGNGRPRPGRRPRPHGPLARLERPADVRVRLAQIGRDGVDHLVGHLCAARPVEQHEIAPERAVARSNSLDVERTVAARENLLAFLGRRAERLAFGAQASVEYGRRRTRQRTTSGVGLGDGRPSP